ncbi:MAG: alkaline phosphatase family protein [Planctomycetaceae bacterium]|nr:alkaline phosphatase family protein [Planctomycetaceae bacterium]
MNCHLNLPQQRLVINVQIGSRSLLWLGLTLVMFGTTVAHADDKAGSASSRSVPLTENVLFITVDGLRWQEVFGGADESPMNKDFGGVKNLEELRTCFWHDDASGRRQSLLPFFWSDIASLGRVYGDPEQGGSCRVANPHKFSYPGYNETLTGIPDPTVDSNAKKPNSHVTVLEWLHQREPFRGRVAAFGSWDVFPYIINAERSGIPVNAGWQPLDTAGNDPELAALDRLADELPRYFDNVRYDYFTFRGALAAIQRDQPRVLYVAFGETDDWAHAGRYDLYLDAALRTDHYIRQLWEAMQAIPQYAGKTTLVLTTDHGRGDTRVEWKSHGEEIPGSDIMWIAVMGPDTPSGPAKDVSVTQSQTAATVARLLGYDYHADVPASAPPLPGAIREVP